MVGGNNVFATSASPAVGPEQKKLAMSPSPTVHGGHSMINTKDETFEYLLHAVFVVDTTWGDKLEPVRI